MYKPEFTNGTHPDHTRSNGDNGSLPALKRPNRNDSPFEAKLFPDSKVGKILDGIILSFLIKQEPRLGWGRKRACDESELLKHPCEVVASHQWGVCWLITCLETLGAFHGEISHFDSAIALKMGLIHDLAESITGDITPVDGISAEEKHRMESEAMTTILSRFPEESAEILHQTYSRYEARKCIESKFVKDCDRLDFILTAFMLERQGFSGFSEFYVNTNKGFHTELARNLAETLIDTRNRLALAGTLHPK